MKYKELKNQTIKREKCKKGIDIKKQKKERSQERQQKKN